MARPLLSYRAIARALVDRLLENDAISEGRHAYVGGSEVGSCPRLLAYRKALQVPFRPDPDGAGVMLPGRLAENEAIQLLRRIGLDRALSATGRSQADLRDDESPLGCHPDGFVSDSAFDLDPLSTYFKADGSAWDIEELAPLLVGPGVVEVKSGSSTVFRATVRKGISPTYFDQTQSEMGLSGRLWTLVVFVCRDNLSRVALFFVPFSEARFLELRRMASATMGCASLVRQALADAQIAPEDPEDPRTIEVASPFLPEPDESRGYCSKCPLRHSCPALGSVEEGSYFPEAALDEVSALAEVYDEAASREKAAKEDKDEAKSRLVLLGENYGATRARLSGLLGSLSLTKNKGRVSIDTERLKTKYPEAYADCAEDGDPYWTVRVSKKKGSR